MPSPFEYDYGYEFAPPTLPEMQALPQYQQFQFTPYNVDPRTEAQYRAAADLLGRERGLYGDPAYWQASEQQAQAQFQEQVGAGNRALAAQQAQAGVTGSAMAGQQATEVARLNALRSAGISLDIQGQRRAEDAAILQRQLGGMQALQGYGLADYGARLRGQELQAGEGRYGFEAGVAGTQYENVLAQQDYNRRLAEELMRKQMEDEAYGRAFGEWGAYEGMRTGAAGDIFAAEQQAYMQQQANQAALMGSLLGATGMGMGAYYGAGGGA
jgi:hypothetical protein